MSTSIHSHTVRSFNLLPAVACTAIVFAVALSMLPASATERVGWYKARADIASDSSDLTGRADYKERTRRDALEQRLHVKIRHGEPNTLYSVTFNGVPLGEITTNDEGNGKLKLRTRQFIHNNDWDPFPQNFPTIIDGDVLEVGLAAGTFAVR